MKAESVTSSYRRWAPIYDKTFGAVTHAGRRRTCTHVSGKSGHVLEVGVGTGLALPFYSGNIRVTGIDFSDEMLAKAKERVSEENLTNVENLLQMDARELKFEDNRFDFVVAMHVLSVVPEPEKVMAEIARVCKPGGEVIIVNHFAREKGVLAVIERITSPLEDMLGWQSDFDISTVLGEPSLTETERQSLPPFGLMTYLRLTKRRLNS